MKKKSIRGTLIPDLTEMPMPISYEAIPMKALKIPIDPLKDSVVKDVKKAPTLKDLRAECKKRELATSGTKNILTKRLAADDNKIFEEKRLEVLRKETIHRNKINEENEMVRRILDNKVVEKQSELKAIRVEIVDAYTKLRKQQNKCSQLDNKAQEIRTTIKALIEG